MYQKEDRYLQVIRMPDGSEKSYVPKSKEQMIRNKEYAKSHGMVVVSCKKLYPFSSEKNQHNFDLVHNVIQNRLFDAFRDGVKIPEAELDRLHELDRLAQEFFCLPLPVAWLPWEDWQKAKEIAELAIIHRQNVCIENGRFDLLQYC